MRAAGYGHEPATGRRGVGAAGAAGAGAEGGGCGARGRHAGTEIHSLGLGAADAASAAPARERNAERAAGIVRNTERAACYRSQRRAAGIACNAERAAGIARNALTGATRESTDESAMIMIR